MRIQLEIKEYADLEAIEKNFGASTYRLIVQLQMKLKEGWSDYMAMMMTTITGIGTCKCD